MISPTDGLRRQQGLASQTSHRSSGQASAMGLAPNDICAADFKGQFKTGNGRLCYRLYRHGSSQSLPALLPGLPSTRLRSRQAHVRQAAESTTQH
jgi:hypothetical protein